MRFKYIILILMLFALILGLTSCLEETGEETDSEIAEEEHEDTRQTNVPQNIPPESDSRSDERLFLIGVGYSEFGVFPLPEFVAAENYGIKKAGVDFTFDNIAKKTRRSPFDPDREIIYSHSDCYFESANSNKFGSFYSIYDVYTFGNDEYYYLHGTDLLCKYFASSDGEPEIILDPLPVDEQTTKQACENLLSGILGEDFSSKYEVTRILKEPSQKILYKVVYKRVWDFEGYHNDDLISVYVRKDGGLDAINGHNANKYDPLIDRIKEDDLEEAKVILLEKLEKLEGFELDMFIITTDPNGNLFLRCHFYYTDSEGQRKESDAYVNIT